jgi:hypothetical protein
MRLVLLLAIAACAAHAAPSAPPSAPVAAGPEWDSLRPLLGTWEGSDPAKHETGRFTLAPDLGGKILLRRNTNDSPQGHHEDLMVIESGGKRASYWDNEGHVIHYAITADATHIELVSDEVTGAPRFRLTYVVKGPDELAIDFAIQMPGASEFQHYTGGTVHRVR